MHVQVSLACISANVPATVSRPRNQKTSPRPRIGQGDMSIRTIAISGSAPRARAAALPARRPSPAPARPDGRLAGPPAPAPCARRAPGAPSLRFADRGRSAPNIGLLEHPTVGVGIRRPGFRELRLGAHGGIRRSQQTFQLRLRHQCPRRLHVHFGQAGHPSRLWLRPAYHIRKGRGRKICDFRPNSRSPAAASRRFARSGRVRDLSRKDCSRPPLTPRSA